MWGGGHASVGRGVVQGGWESAGKCVHVGRSIMGVKHCNATYSNDS